MLTKLLAYFNKYVETYNLTDDEIRILAEVIGLDKALAVIEGGMAVNNKTLEGIISDAGGLLNLIINQIRDGKEDSVIEWLLKWIGGWKSEEVGEEWYDTLLIPNAVGGINAYFERVSEINRQCRGSTERVFDEANEADRANAERVRSLVDEMKSVRSLIKTKAARLNQGET